MQFIVLGLLRALLQEKAHLVEDALSVEKSSFIIIMLTTEAP